MYFHTVFWFRKTLQKSVETILKMKELGLLEPEKGVEKKMKIKERDLGYSVKHINYMLNHYEIEYEREKRENEHSYGCGFAHGYRNALRFVMNELKERGFKFED